MEQVRRQLGKTLKLIISESHVGANDRRMRLQSVVGKEQFDVVGYVGHAFETAARRFKGKVTRNELTTTGNIVEGSNGVFDKRGRTLESRLRLLRRRPRFEISFLQTSQRQ